MRLHLGTLLHVCALLPFTRQHKPPDYGKHGIACLAKHVIREPFVHNILSTRVKDMGQAAVFPVVSTHIRLQLAVLSLIAFARASQVATPHVATVL